MSCPMGNVIGEKNFKVIKWIYTAAERNMVNSKNRSCKVKAPNSVLLFNK